MKVKSCESHLKNIFAVRKQSAFFFALSDKLKNYCEKAQNGNNISNHSVSWGSKSKIQKCICFSDIIFTCILSTIVLYLKELVQPPKRTILQLRFLDRDYFKRNNRKQLPIIISIRRRREGRLNTIIICLYSFPVCSLRSHTNISDIY